MSRPEYCSSCGERLDRLQGRCCGVTHRFGLRELLGDPQGEFRKARRWRREILGELESMAVDRESWRNNDVEVSGILLFNKFDVEENFAAEINLMGSSVARADKELDVDLLGFIEDGAQSGDVPQESFNQVMGVKHHADSAIEGWDEYFKSRGACYSVRHDLIIFEHISPDFLGRVGLDMRDVPPILKPLMDYILSDITMDRMRSRIDHELTHAWLKKNTRIGREQARAISGDVDSFDSEGQISASQQILEVTRNSDLRTIDEIFGYILNMEIGNSQPVLQSLKDTGYQDPEMIKWGSTVLSQKYQKMKARGEISEGSDILVDWARELEGEIYREILMKGQVNRRPLISFLKHCMYSSDREKMRNIKKIVEEELKPAIQDVRDALNKVEEYEEKQDHSGLVSDLRTVENDFDWDEPERFEEKVLDDVVEAAADSINERNTVKTLDWVSRALKKLVSDELESLKRYEAELKKLEKELPDRKEKEELQNALNEIRKVRQDINRKVYS